MTWSIVAVSGSLRSGSSNTGLAHMAVRLAPAELSITVDDTIAGLPFYDADLDTPEALPEPVVRWRATVGAADGLWLCTPEYNFGPSGVLKNAIDWLSRPPGDHTLRGKAVAIVSSGGKGGGTRVQDQLNLILGLLGNTMVTEPPIALVLGAQRVTADGSTTDPEVEQLVSARLAAMVDTLRGRDA